MTDIRSAKLIDFVPDSISDDPEIVALSAVIDPELQAVATAVLEAIIWPRVDDQPEAVLDAMAWDMKLSELRIWDTASVAKKKAMLAGILRTRKRAGTRYAVRRICELLEFVHTIYEWWEESGTPCTYRIEIDGNATAEGVITVAALQAVPEMLLRFAPARAQLSSLDVTIEESGVALPRAALTVGRLTTIAYGG